MSGMTKWCFGCRSYGLAEVARLNAPFRKETRIVGCCFQNGMFERLISFMDFEGALVALIDDEQKKAVHELFDKLADLYIAMIQKYIDALDVQEVLFMTTGEVRERRSSLWMSAGRW